MSNNSTALTVFSGEECAINTEPIKEFLRKDAIPHGTPQQLADAHQRFRQLVAQEHARVLPTKGFPSKLKAHQKRMKRAREAETVAIGNLREAHRDYLEALTERLALEHANEFAVIARRQILICSKNKIVANIKKANNAFNNQNLHQVMEATDTENGEISGISSKVNSYIRDNGCIEQAMEQNAGECVEDGRFSQSMEEEQ